MNTKDKGDIAEAIVISKMLSCGYSVSVPFGDNQKYDMIIDMNGTLVKAQVKYRAVTDGAIEIPFRSIYSTTKGTVVSYYKKGEIDVVIAYCPDNEKIYWIDFSSITNKTGICLRVDKTGHITNQGSVRMAEDYEFDGK